MTDRYLKYKDLSIDHASIDPEGMIITVCGQTFHLKGLNWVSANPYTISISDWVRLCNQSKLAFRSWADRPDGEKGRMLRMQYFIESCNEQELTIHVGTIYGYA